MAYEFLFWHKLPTHSADSCSYYVDYFSDSVYYQLSDQLDIKDFWTIKTQYWQQVRFTM